MKNELIPFLSGVLGVGIVSCLFPNRKTISGVLKLLTALLILGAVITPLQSLLNTFSFQTADDWLQNYENTQSYESEWNESLLNATGEYLEKTLCTYLQNQYGINEGELRCSVEMSEDGQVNKISLILSGKAMWKDPTPMEKEVTELFDCPCESLIA